jgi:hypothetical protein
MKTRKTLLTALVLGAMTVPSVFATTTALPENASDQYARTTYFGKGNTTEDTTLTERSTVIGSLNSIKRATDMTTIIGDSNSVDGKNNTVIGSINIVQGHDSVVIGAGAQAGASVVPDGDDAPLLTLGSAEGHGVTVIGTNAWANTEYASSIGYATQSLGKNSIALGSYSAAGEMHAADSKYAGVSNNKGVLSIGAKDPSSTINYSNPIVNEPWANDFTRQIQHVSAGEVSATSTDAINGSQLQDAFDRSATNATNIATNAANIIKAKTTVTAGNGVTVTDSTNTDGSTNYEVAVAKALTDQVEANKNGIDGLNGRVGKNADAIQANADAIRDLQVGVTAAGTDVTGKGPIKVRRSMALNGGSTFEVSLDQSVTNQIKANTDGINGLDGKIGENVKAIDGLKSDVAAAKTTVSAGNGVTVNETVNSNGSTNYLVAVDTKVTDQIKANKDGIDGLNAKVADNTNAIKANTDGINGLNGKVGENTKAIDGLNGKVSDNTKAIANNANGIKANADAIKVNKDGIALNTAAINELADRVANGTNALNNKINDVQKEGRRGVASASALAALHPLDYNPDHKLDVMAGVGHYRGNNAVALGVAYRPNENLLFTVGTSINGKDTAINAGVSYKVGAKESTYMSPATMAKEIEELKAIIREMQAK